MAENMIDDWIYYRKVHGTYILGLQLEVASTLHMTSRLTDNMCCINNRVAIPLKTTPQTRTGINSRKMTICALF